LSFSYESSFRKMWFIKKAPKGRAQSVPRRHFAKDGNVRNETINY